MTLDAFNALPRTEAVADLIKCCGAHRWAEQMADGRPYASTEALLRTADAIWAKMERADILEAFTHHPKIGDVDSLRKKFASTAAWASGEQSGVNSAAEEVIRGLADGNRKYEQRFGYIFIVCATGKSAAEMLAILNGRLGNEPGRELAVAAEEQRKITAIRLKKLLDSNRVAN